MCKKLEKIRYDQGWVLLIKEAKNMGLSREEVRVILKEGKNNPQYTVQ